MSLSSSSALARRRLLAPRAGAEGGGGGVRARVAGGGVGRGDAGRATLRDERRGDRRGGLMGSGLWRRWALVDRRVEGAGDPFRRDCSARQVPSRPLPEVLWSTGGGVEKRRLGVKRDDRRTSQERADGRSMMSEGDYDCMKGSCCGGSRKR
jgi:hypothetical protein